MLTLALPTSHERDAPSFHFTEDLPNVASNIPGVQASLVIGSALGHTTSLPSYSPAFLLDVALEAGSRFELPIEAGHEGAVYCSEGEVEIGVPAATLHEGSMGVFTGDSTTTSTIVVTATAQSRVAILGGAPFPEKRFIWWNFVASDKALIAEAAHNWQTSNKEVFGSVVNERDDDFIPLPTPYKA
mmetsp:Transcript_21415/g.53441  ORF Transcript_21415/g.53441 Transcript_21415/m.53441 type:complete len:186 (-) Transcript_21415:173-730(-)